MPIGTEGSVCSYVFETLLAALGERVPRDGTAVVGRKKLDSTASIAQPLARIASAYRIDSRAVRRL